MKFLCGNCKAKYQIADKKVSGRTLRMKCRRCGHDILIDGHSMPQPSSAQAAPGGRRTVASTVSVMPGPGARGGSGAHVAPRAPAPGLPRPGARSKPPSGLNAEFRRHVAAPPEVPQRSAPYDFWHVAIHDVPVGPMTRDELGRKIDAGAVTPESLCWREGMDDWRPLGELPELAQLLRRSREGHTGRGRVPPSVPAHERSRPAPLPSDVEDQEEEGAEPTRVTEFTPPLPAPALPATGTSSVQGAASSSTAGGSSVTATTAPGLPGGVEAPHPTPSKGTSGITTGVAFGLLGGILLVGGPMLYNNTWGSSARTPAQQTASAPAPQTPPRTAANSPVEFDMPAAEEARKPAREANAGAGKGGAARTAKNEPPPKPGGKTLSDEQRRLLERMGGGSNDPDLSKLGGGREDGAGSNQPTLTPQQLTKVVQDNKAQLQRCYETALRAAGGKQEAAIKISVNVVVGISGSTKSVSTQGEGLGVMTDCIRSSVKRWRFPQSGGESEFQFPLVFQPGA